jgi:transcriptional regulator with XRE-family HTH domain
MRDDPSTNLARNLRQLREARRLTQAQLATLAGLPRPTVANLESGEANPTLAVLVKAGAALQVSVEELIGPPRAIGRHYAAAELPERRKGDATVRRLLPERHPGFDIERMVLPPGGRMTGVPHTPGTREYLTCEIGTMELTVSGERYRLLRGDVVVFRGDQPHAYRNAGEEEAIAYSVIAVAAGE